MVKLDVLTLAVSAVISTVTAARVHVDAVVTRSVTAARRTRALVNVH